MVSVFSVVKWSQRRPAVVRRPSGLAGRQQGRRQTQAPSGPVPQGDLRHGPHVRHPDAPELQATGRDVVAALVGIAPKTSVEAMLGMHNAVADSLRMARRSSGRSRRASRPC